MNGSIKSDDDIKENDSIKEEGGENNDDDDIAEKESSNNDESSVKEKLCPTCKVSKLHACTAVKQDNLLLEGWK